MSEDKPFAAIPSTQDLDEVLFSINPQRRESLEKKLPHQIEVELTNQCSAGCVYCYAASTPEDEELLPTERCLQLVDEMGAENISSCVFKPGLGFAREHLDFEPSLSEVRRFMEHLARKTGHDRLRTGPSPLGTVYCRTNFTVHSNGDVTPCAVLTRQVAGNIFREGLAEIFHKNKEMLLFDCEVKGACASCENNDICNGCRANAFHYLRDLYAEGGPHFVGRGPKCWLNPEAKELYLQP